MRGVSHVAIGVSDMDRALKFYRDVLGLKVALDAQETLPRFNRQPGDPAAIASAVHHATGRRIRDLPIRPEMLL